MGVTELTSGRPAVVFGFGHSHLSAMQFAYAEWANARADAPKFHFAQLLAPPYGLGGTPAEMGERFGIRLREELERFGGESLVFTSFAGNEHHQYSLVRDARPFDFVLPERPELPLTPGVEIVPYRAVAAQLERHCMHAMITLVEISRRLARPLVSLSAPPPIPDNDHVAKADNMFREVMAQRGPSPPALRLKFWLLQSLTYERLCQRAGIRFIWPPQAAVDEQGYLLQEHWHPDGVHALPSYGAHVLDQLLAYARSAEKAEV